MKILRNTLWAAVGLFALAAVVAAPASADQVILDDLIVDGSACIGLDCVNGESFGFDTLRLKENNLRIKAQDTSTSASFPDNQWQITFNESSNGGLEKFSIDDISNGRIPFTIEASAPTNSLYVENSGELGLGTNNPVVEVHIVDGDTPTLRLEQDGSSGFTPQTWDVAGNETNFFIRDVTNGSKLPFRIRPNAPTSSIDVEGSTGDVGFGTTSPAEPIHVLRSDASSTYIRIENTNGAAQLTGVQMDNSDAGAEWTYEVQANGNFQVSQAGTGGGEVVIRQNQSGNGAKFRFGGNDGGGFDTLMEIQADGDVNSLSGNFATISDRNVKQDINPVDPSAVLAKVAAMPISTWRYKKNSDELHMGPMAQDFWAAFGLHEGPTIISVTDLAGVALAAVQGLNGEIESKDRVIQELLDRVSALEAKLAE